MKRRKWAILVAVLLMCGLLLTAGPVAADGTGPVTRFTGVAIETEDLYLDDVDWTPLPGGRLLGEGATLGGRRYLATDPRITGEGSLYINGIFQNQVGVMGVVKAWGDAQIVVGTWDNGDFTPTGGVWNGKWHGVHVPSYDGTFPFVFTGTGGDLEGLRMKMVLKIRYEDGVESMTISGFISEVHGD